MDLMNGLQRVNLTAMRLATLIWLAGIACCVPGMAAEPQQKEQTAAEKRIAPPAGDILSKHRSGSRLARSHGFDAGGRNPAERA